MKIAMGLLLGLATGAWAAEGAGGRSEGEQAQAVPVREPSDVQVQQVLRDAETAPQAKKAEAKKADPFPTLPHPAPRK